MAHNGSSIDLLLRRPVGFLNAAAGGDDIVISSRIRLARNIRDFAFPIASDRQSLEEVIQLVARAVRETGALRKDFLSFFPGDMDGDGREILFERRLASRDLLGSGRPSAVFCRRDESCSVMVNEEDHLRLQLIRPGLQIEQCWEMIDRIDDKLGERLPYAFDREWGYLTSCPTNLGTGMRASAMLHLPALVMVNEIGKVIAGIGKINFTVRGVFGEGTASVGNLFQISNQSTLGESEGMIIERLRNIILAVSEAEKQARASLAGKKGDVLLSDSIGRAYGILKYAYRIGYEEAMNSLSLLRLGIDLGAVKNVDIQTVNDLLVGIGKAHLRKISGSAAADGAALDIARSALLRSKLREEG